MALDNDSSLHYCKVCEDKTHHRENVLQMYLLKNYCVFILACMIPPLSYPSLDSRYDSCLIYIK